jgi:fluoride exporter
MDGRFDVLLVGLGGFAGAVSRFGVGVLLSTALGSSFPWGTLAVNLTGCFVAGVLIGMGDGRGLATGARLLLVTGFLGGYTTFSAFGVETVRLAEQQGMALAGANVATNVVGGLALAMIGLVVGRAL